MALHPLSARELAAAPTLFATFMGCAGDRRRTVGELLDIYRRRSWGLRPAEDGADHLRVERFMDDMENARWREDVVVRIGEFDDGVLVIDGIHRGIAYLGCIERGVSAAALPAVCVER